MMYASGQATTPAIKTTIRNSFMNKAIMPATEEAWFKEKLELICKNKAANLPTYSLEKEIDDKLFDLYDLTENERSLVRSVVDLSTVSDLEIISISSGVSA